MCDTFVALGNSTEDGSVIFGKNSDRPNNEVQLITHSPKMKHSKGEMLRCTHLSIPQAKETAEIILSQPWWMWGAEMGVNEFNVVIGNEAVYSLEPLRNVGLLGMDLLRLGLERSKNAKDATHTIINLLEEFGQGGGCAHNDSSWLYHNSFLIADPKDAYVLETADKWWIAEKVRDVRSISNGFSISGKGDFRREGIIQHAIDMGYCKDDDSFDFASSFSGMHVSNILSPHSRAGKSALLLENNKNKITPALMMDFLREHDAGICMHGSFESTGSQVSHLCKGTSSIHWFTGSALPCLSLYKPFIFPLEGQLVYKSGPYKSIIPEWYWCQHHEKIKFIDDHDRYVKELYNYQNKMIRMVNQAISANNNLINTTNINRLKELNLKAWEISRKMIA